MAMGSGFWLNPENYNYVEVDRHEKSIIRPEDQNKLDLNQRQRSVIAVFKPGDKDFEGEVRLAALREGLIRIRGDMQDSNISIEFYKGEDGRLRSVKSALDAIQFFIVDSSADDAKKRMSDPLTRLLSRAFKLNITRLFKDSEDARYQSDSIQITPKDFLTKMEAGGSIMREAKKEKPIRSCSEITKSMSESSFRTFEKKYMNAVHLAEEMDTLFESNCVTNKALYNEEKLSRVWQMAKTNGYTWGIISAYRGDKSEIENKQRQNQLKKEIRKAGFGFWELEGHWLETQKDGTKVDKKEKALFVAAPKTVEGNKIKEFIVQKTEEYDQDGGIYKDDPEEDAPIMLYQYKDSKEHPDGTKERVVDRDHFSIGKFNANKIAENYSKIIKSGRTFVFESVCDNFIIDEFQSIDGKMIGMMDEEDIQDNIDTYKNKSDHSFCGSISRTAKLRALENALQNIEKG
jgi:hypothetical protein